MLSMISVKLGLTFLVTVTVGILLFGHLGQPPPRVLKAAKKDRRKGEGEKLKSDVTSLISPSAPRLHWHPTVCSAGADLLWNGSALLEGCKPGGELLAELGQSYCEEAKKGISFCGQYSEGIFSPKIDPEELPQIREALDGADDCITFSSSIKVDDSWSMSIDPVLAVPSSYPYTLRHPGCPSFHYFTHIQAMSIFNGIANRSAARGGRAVLFSGDSLIRQLFLNVVALLRHEPVVTDFYSHTDYIYIAYPSRDVFNEVAALHMTEHCSIIVHWLPGLLKGRKKRPVWCPPSTITEEPLFVLLFLWDVTPAAPREEIFLIPVSLHVGGYFLWWYGSSDPNAAQAPGGMAGAPVNISIVPFLTRMASLLAWQKQRKFVWLTTPQIAEGHSLLLKLGSLYERNERMRRWVREGIGYDVPLTVTTPSTQAARADNQSIRTVQRLVVDFAGIVALGKAKGITGRSDGLHQTCGWLPSRPGPIKSLNPNGQHCRDPINAAVVQWLLHLMVQL